MAHVKRSLSAVSALKIVFWLACYLSLPHTLQPLRIYDCISSPATPSNRRCFPAAERIRASARGVLLEERSL